MWLMVLGCTSHPSEWWGRYPWFARGLPDWCLVEGLAPCWGGWRRAVLLGLLECWSCWGPGFRADPPSSEAVGAACPEPVVPAHPWICGAGPPGRVSVRE